jgi:hypothetical protein
VQKNERAFTLPHGNWDCGGVPAVAHVPLVKEMKIITAAKLAPNPIGIHDLLSTVR